jgi:hypothetical protein
MKVWGNLTSPAGLYLSGLVAESAERNDPQRRHVKVSSMNEGKHAIPRNEQVIQVSITSLSGLSNAAGGGCLHSGRRANRENSDVKEDVWQ